MTTAVSNPYIDLLNNTTEFPVLTDILAKLNRLIEDENASVNALAMILKNNSNLAEKILKIVNSVNFVQYGGTISNLTKAVQILGFEKIRSTTINVVLLESIKSEKASPEIKNLTTESFFAGILAKHIAEYEKTADDLIVSSVMEDIGRILIMYHYPDKASAILKTTNDTFANLSAELSTYWNMPKTFTEEFDSNLKKMLHISKEITKSARETSARDKIFKIRTILNNFAEDLNLSVHQVKLLISKSIDEFKERSKYMMSSIVDLSLIKSLTEIITAPSILDTSEIKEAPSEEAIGAVLTAGLKMTKEATTEHDLKRLVVTMHKALDADSTVFMKLDSSTNIYTGKYTIGFNDTDIAKLKFNFLDKSIMSECVRTEKPILVTDAQFSKEAINVPLWYQNINLMSSILCLPIANNGEVLGVLVLGSKHKNMLRLSVSHLPVLITFIRWVVTKSRFR